MIPDKAVEAAAIGIASENLPSKPWGTMSEGVQDTFRSDARAALEAALPHLASAAKQPQRTSPTDWPDVPRRQ